MDDFIKELEKETGINLPKQKELKDPPADYYKESTKIDDFLEAEKLVGFTVEEMDQGALSTPGTLIKMVHGGEVKYKTNFIREKGGWLLIHPSELITGKLLTNWELLDYMAGNIEAAWRALEMGYSVREPDDPTAKVVLPE